MIDIHCHILANLDDGAQSISESLDMAKQAVQQGITHMIATPHYKPNCYNHAEVIQQKVDELQRILDENKIPLTIFYGQEVRIVENLFERIEAGEIQFLDEDNRYLLLEFPTLTVPHYSLELVQELVGNGMIPIIAHPERNAVFMKDLTLLSEFIAQGALAQVTAASVLGVYQTETIDITHKMLEHGLIHIVASDTHNIGGRKNYLKEAYQKIEKRYGQEAVEWLKNNAKAVCNGDEIEEDSFRFKPKKWKLHLF